MKRLNLFLSMIKEPMTLDKYRKYSIYFIGIFIVLLLFKNYIAPIFTSVGITYENICLDRILSGCIKYGKIEKETTSNPAITIILLSIWIGILCYLFISIKRLINVKLTYPDNFKLGFLSYSITTFILTIILLFSSFVFVVIIIFLSPILIALSIKSLLSEKKSESKIFWWKLLSNITYFNKLIIYLKDSRNFSFIKKNILYIGFIYFIFVAITYPLWVSGENSVAIGMVILPVVILLLFFLLGTINLVRMLYFVGK